MKPFIEEKNKMESRITELVKSSGLEKTKAQMLMENFNDYFMLAHDWENRAKTIKVTSENQKTEMKMARIGRLELRQKRIDIEKTRKRLKEQSVREGKAIDGVANILKALIVPIEEYLEKQEKFVEMKQREEAKQKAEAERIAREKKEEEERRRNEELDRLEQKRKMEALPFKQFWPEGNFIDFRTASNAEFSNFMINVTEKKDKFDMEQAKIKEQNKKLLEKIEEEKKRKIEQQKKADEQARKILEKAERDRIQREKEIEDAKRKQKEAEDRLKNEVTCPHCKKKFNLKLEGK